VEATIRIQGRVQGVGFRPFIYRKAVSFGLKGYVVNLGDAGVEVVVEGNRGTIEAFVSEVERNAPEVSEVRGVAVSYGPYRGRFRRFRIERSRDVKGVLSGIFPPDIGICDQCLEDMENPESRWYNYAFTACAWCGPRFTAIKALPYDRERTHMDKFPMCDLCKRDYNDPMNRRFDAQGITCPHCGPRMMLYDSAGRLIEVDDIFKEVSHLLMEGCIVAVKGIGGIHLASLATDDDVIMALRRKKNRPYQPFALMSPDLMAVRKFAVVTPEEEGVLRSWRRPIVLLLKKGRLISDLVAPGLSRVGVMLPYTGIHHMLFEYLTEPALIMTSGNKPGLPMCVTNEEALRALRGIADYFLLHNREIVNRCDDSVLRVIRGRCVFLRRSRGYVPDPIRITIERGVSITLGAELRNAAAITIDGRCFLTQYLGDVTNLEVLEFESTIIHRFLKVLKVTRDPDVIGCDLHPVYLTSRLAEEISQEFDASIVRSQHHHAHIASVAAENGLSPDETFVGIALDGVGYGLDGEIWGGEMLIADYSGFERRGHLEYLPMPGGDLCTFYPLRMLIAALSKTASEEEIRDITQNHIAEGLPYGDLELHLILRSSKSPGITRTSSAGRFLDAIAALCGICYKRTYEGEPAMRLEAAALKGDPRKINLPLEISEEKGAYVLKTSNIFLQLSEKLDQFSIFDVAAFGQRYLAEGVAEISSRIAEEEGLRRIVLSGGVFANQFITQYIIDYLSERGLEVLRHGFVPPGDGGIALGQSVISLSNVM
jgi:hydrogenase maturation protein HypF